MNTNFTESSTTGDLNSDLSVLNSKYWTTTNKEPKWKGAEDAAVDSVGTVTVAPKALNAYKIVLPEAADASGNLELAKDELILFFAEATGVTLEVAADNAYATTEAYISIGNTKMYERAELNLGDARGQGYRIQTAGTSLFINAESTLGCVYGVYGLLEELFGYEQFSVDCYTLNKVEMDVLPEMDITENPSFNARVPVSGTVKAKEEYAARMRMVNETYILKAGDYLHGGGMKEYHNALEILPPSYWKSGAGNKPNWFNDAGTQLCYTAHGNADDYKAMVAQIVDVITLLTLNSDSFSTSNFPEAKYITLTIPDNEDCCECAACTKAKNTYGSDAGAVINLCNDVREGIETWMDKNPTKKRDLTLLFFAYNRYFDAPVTLNAETGKYELNGGLTMRPDVGVWLAGSSYANYYYDINDSKNDDFRTAVQKWADVTNASGSDLCLWTYSLNNADYMIHADMYGETTFYNTNAYKFFAEMGVDMYYNQGPWNATETVTAFNRLNIYLDSQMMWDSTQSVTELTEKYFTAMYGAGASYMKQLYAAENAASKKLFNTDIEGVPNEYNNNVFDKFFSAITKREVNTWLQYISDAKAAVNAASDLDAEQKARYIAHIDEEWIAVKYWQMSNPYNWSVDKDAALAEFRAVLGYDATTQTYAKDVTIGERYGYTLTDWIKNNFSSP